MANNRMRLKCRVCGKTLPLAKSMGSGYYVSPAFSQENLEEFLIEHSYCMNGDGSIIPDEGNYCIAYENPAEGQETF